MALEVCECASDPGLYVPRPTQVVAVTPKTEMETLLTLRLADGSDMGHVPGQFVQVYLQGIGEAPISVASTPNAERTFDLCVRKLGDVTRALHGLQIGRASCRERV